MTHASTPSPAKACPICGKPAALPHRPFCSARCADVDLHRWLSGTYRIESDEDAPPPDPEGREDT